MQALILATDEQSKLRPLTERVPAPLLPVLNRPIMAYPLELLVRAGVRDIAVAVYHQAGRIEAHFGAGTGTGARLTYYLQREPLGSAGSLRWAAPGLNETFIALPGDALLDFDVDAALAFHRSHGGIATIIAHRPAPAYPVNPVAVAADGAVVGLPGASESAHDTASPVSGARLYADTGARIFEPRIFDCIALLQRQRQRGALDDYADLLPELLGGEGAHAYVAEGYWNPLQNVPAYHRAQMDALADACGAGEGARYARGQDRDLAQGILAGRHVSVHPSARLVAPVYIGAGSQIARDAEVGPCVVIGANTVVDEGATIRNSAILEGSYVGRLVNVEERVVRGGLVVDARSGDHLRIVDPFLLGDVSPRLAATLLSRAADWIGALLLLLVSLPVLAPVAAALLLLSPFTGGPGRLLELTPKVRWQRTGEDDAPERQTYFVPRFRTRRENGALIPLGAFLERTRIDWLPALLSVLRGDLRLVGVKPLSPSEADRLVEEWQRLPYEGPAGFTGLWFFQPRGADLDEMVATDAYYSATRRFAEDLRLALLTPVAWLAGLAPGRAASRRPPKIRARSRSAAHLRNLSPAEDAAPKRAGD